jgi:hypothetical protein
LGRSSVLNEDLVVLISISFIYSVKLILPLIWKVPKWSIRWNASVTIVLEVVYCRSNLSNVFILRLYPNLVHESNYVHLTAESVPRYHHCLPLCVDCILEGFMRLTRMGLELSL